MSLSILTRAAHALNIAQPALSRQVRLLEVELRQTLLLRNGRGAVPTEAGKLLLDHGRGILHQVERAREDLGRVRGALAGRVAIATVKDDDDLAHDGSLCAAPREARRLARSVACRFVWMIRSVSVNHSN